MRPDGRVGPSFQRRLSWMGLALQHSLGEKHPRSLFPTPGSKLFLIPQRGRRGGKLWGNHRDHCTRAQHGAKYSHYLSSPKITACVHSPPQRPALTSTYLCFGSKHQGAVVKHPALLMANRAGIAGQKRALRHLTCIPSLALGGCAWLRGYPTSPSAPPWC